MQGQPVLHDLRQALLDACPQFVWHQFAKPIGQPGPASRLFTVPTFTQDARQHLRQHARSIVVRSHSMQCEHHHRRVVTGLVDEATDRRVASNVDIAQGVRDLLELDVGCAALANLSVPQQVPAPMRRGETDDRQIPGMLPYQRAAQLADASRGLDALVPNRDAFRCAEFVRGFLIERSCAELTAYLVQQIGRRRAWLLQQLVSRPTRQLDAVVSIWRVTEGHVDRNDTPIVPRELSPERLKRHPRGTRSFAGHLLRAPDQVVVHAEALRRAAGVEGRPGRADEPVGRGLQLHQHTATMQGREIWQQAVGHPRLDQRDFRCIQSNHQHGTTAGH